MKPQPQPQPQTSSNTPPEECCGPWYTKSGKFRPEGDGDGWMCEVCGDGSECPEVQQWSGEEILICSVPIVPK